MFQNCILNNILKEKQQLSTWSLYSTEKVFLVNKIDKIHTHYIQSLVV